MVIVSPFKRKKQTMTAMRDEKVIESVNDNPVVVIKEEFPIGSLVSIHGFDLDNGRWKSRCNAPTFFEYIEDPSNFDTTDAS